MKKKWSKRRTAAALSLQLHSENCFSNTRNIQSSSSEASYYYSYYSYYYHRHTVVSVSSDGHWWSSAPVLWVSTVSGLLQTDSFKLIYRHFLGPNWPWVQSLWWSITTACLEEHTLPHVNEGTCGWRGCVLLCSTRWDWRGSPPPRFQPPHMYKPLMKLHEVSSGPLLYVLCRHLYFPCWPPADYESIKMWGLFFYLT